MGGRGSVSGVGSGGTLSANNGAHRDIIASLAPGSVIRVSYPLDDEGEPTHAPEMFRLETDPYYPGHAAPKVWVNMGSDPYTRNFESSPTTIKHALENTEIKILKKKKK